MEGIMSRSLRTFTDFPKGSSYPTVGVAIEFIVIDLYYGFVERSGTTTFWESIEMMRDSYDEKFPGDKYDVYLKELPKPNYNEYCCLWFITSPGHGYPVTPLKHYPGVNMVKLFHDLVREKMSLIRKRKPIGVSVLTYLFKSSGGESYGKSGEELKVYLKQVESEGY